MDTRFTEFNAFHSVTHTMVPRCLTSYNKIYLPSVAFLRYEIQIFCISYSITIEYFQTIFQKKSFSFTLEIVLLNFLDCFIISMVAFQLALSKCLYLQFIFTNLPRRLYCPTFGCSQSVARIYGNTPLRLAAAYSGTRLTSR